MTDMLGPYLLGPNDTPENGIYCGDARELMRTLPDNSATLVVTDPPFGTGTYKTDIEPSHETLQELRRVGTGLFAIMGYPKNLMTWAAHFSDLKLLDYIVWVKYNEPVVSVSLTRKHQDIAIWGENKRQVMATVVREPYSENAALKRYFGSEGTDELSRRIRRNGPVPPNKDGARCSDVWPIAAPNSGFSGHKKRLHKNEKPMELARRIILLLSSPGDIVLDPFVGSGPFPAACKELGRRYLAFDVDPTMVEVARKRLRETQAPLPDFYGKGPAHD